VLKQLTQYHPLVIEGMGGYDPRAPAPVAAAIASNLRSRWAISPPTKPLLLVTQGDPIEARGISAITRLVADELQVPRALIFLDEAIADYHKPNADRCGVIMEIAYSTLVNTLHTAMPRSTETLEQAIDTALDDKNQQRLAAGKPALEDYYHAFARLQEVTKAACKCLCGEITVAHTSNDISDFSVTSFYQVGLALGLVAPQDIATYQD